MNESPIYPKYETEDYCSYEFDYKADFTQFLEEARMSAFQENLSTTHLQGVAKKQMDVEKKKMTSWKNSFFSWLKTDEKNKSPKQPLNSTTISKPRRGHVSGPVQGTVGSIKCWKNAEASIRTYNRYFSSTRRLDEYQVPYICLGQLKSPHDVPSYGPVYLVT